MTPPNKKKTPSSEPVEASEGLFDETSNTLLAPREQQQKVGVVLRVYGASAEPNEFRLGDQPCQVGSGSTNQIVISDRTVSRVHAEFVRTPQGVSITDLGSRNGTFYLGQKIEKASLAIGTRVQVGQATVAIDPDTESLLAELEYNGSSYRGILGASPRMRKLFALLQRLEGSLATVLIEGESGAGKEGVARAIHDGSPVSKGPYVVLNCGAIAKELIASELFGHRKGAFTGAVDQRKGAFLSADGGTLFLDEMGELPLDIQPHLLRALESGEIRPVGTDETKRVKVRVIAATNRDLQEEVRAGRFRQDLFYRLAVVKIQVPPLRGRPEDIELLVKHFAKETSLESVPADVMEELKTRHWAGNARELRNAVQAYAAVRVLPDASAPPLPSLDTVFESMIDPTRPYVEQKDYVIEQFTRVYLKALLRYTSANQSAASRVSKLDRTYLGRLIQKYGLLSKKIDD